MSFTINSVKPALTVRRATRDDLPFLVWCNIEATSPQPEFCYWDSLLEATGTATRDFVEAVFRQGALGWGKIEQFFVLEEGAKPVAGASAFEMNPDDYRPLSLERLPAVAFNLGWS